MVQAISDFFHYTGDAATLAMWIQFGLTVLALFFFFGAMALGVMAWRSADAAREARFESEAHRASAQRLAAEVRTLAAQVERTRTRLEASGRKVEETAERLLSHPALAEPEPQSEELTELSAAAAEESDASPDDAEAEASADERQPAEAHQALDTAAQEPSEEAVEASAEEPEPKRRSLFGLFRNNAERT